MPYLTYEEYQHWGTASVDEEDFLKLLQKASDVVDSVTRSFYQFNDIEQDVPFRREQFKKAVAAQIDYFADMGATSAHMLTNVQSVTVGRTSMTLNGGSGGSIVSQDTLRLLAPTGLLYRGVGTL